MSKEITMQLKEQQVEVTPSRDAIAAALSGHKVISVKEVSVVNGSWQVVADVEAIKAKPKAPAKPKVAAKPKAAAKPKKSLIGSDSE